MIFKKFFHTISLLNFQKRLPPLSGNLQPVLSFLFLQLGSPSLPSFLSLKPHQYSDFDEFKVSTRDALFVLPRISGTLGSLNVSCIMAAISTPASAASLSVRVSEPNGLFVTQSSIFDDQHIIVL